MKKDLMVSGFSTILEKVLRVQKLLQQAIQNETEKFIEFHKAEEIGT